MFSVFLTLGSRLTTDELTSFGLFLAVDWQKPGRFSMNEGCFWTLSEYPALQPFTGVVVHRDYWSHQSCPPYTLFPGLFFRIDQWEIKKGVVFLRFQKNKTKIQDIIYPQVQDFSHWKCPSTKREIFKAVHDYHEEREIWTRWKLLFLKDFGIKPDIIAGTGIPWYYLFNLFNF